MKKLVSIVLALALVLASCAVAFADDPTGSITVTNAAKGETYKAYKLFDATVAATENSTDTDTIAYYGTIPSSLTDYFEYTAEAYATANSGYIKAKAAAWDGNKMSSGLETALTAWANAEGRTAAQTIVADGGEVVFSNLALGYYVVTTSQGNQTISVDSTNLNPQIIDKNTTTPSALKKINGKDVDDAAIGSTVTFTGTFDTANYVGDEQVKSYTISDTLPEYLDNVAITGLTIVQSTTDKTNYPDVNLSASYTAFTNKQIVIPWVNDSNESLYKNGSVITITYTARVTQTVNVNGANTNTITITPNKDKNGDEPFERHYSDDAELWTYGAALKKTDGTNPLAGAQFTIAGLVVTPVANEPGVYMVSSYDASSSTASAVLDTNDNGQLFILGLAKADRPVVTEYKAPDGYNKLTTTVNLVPEELEHTVYRTTRDEYYDAKGNLVSSSTSATSSTSRTKNYTDLYANAVEVINQAGTELPSTGGIGTTIFYIVGGLLVIGAAVILVARRKSHD